MVLCRARAGLRIYKFFKLLDLSFTPEMAALVQNSNWSNLMWLCSEEPAGYDMLLCFEGAVGSLHVALPQKQKGSSGMLLPQAEAKVAMFSSKTDECFSMFSSNAFWSLLCRLSHIKEV
jgi:hypothetical protein